MNKFFSPLGASSLAASLAIAVGAASMAQPAQAGFLDNLFGGGASAPSQPDFQYQTPRGGDDLGLGAPIRPRAPKKIVAAKEAAPVKQKPTDLWHDKTLRVGDAVMMKDGVHIYLGTSGSRLKPKDFAKIDDVENVPKKQYAELTAADSTRNDPLKQGRAPDTLASGRSAAVAAPVTKGYRITDARGASVRYVGP